VMCPTDTPPPDSPSDARARAVRRSVVADRIWYGVLSVTVALVALAALISAAAVRPESCTPCHSGHADELATSSHAALVCDDCHAPRALAGLAENRLRIVAMYPAEAWPGYRPAATRVDNAQCLRCHGEMIPTTITRMGIRMNHRAPEQANWSCTRCHSTVAHGQITALQSWYTMDMCLECHSASPQNISRCDVCHEPGATERGRERERPTPWRITHGRNWRSMHGMGNTSTCKACHTPQYCVSCHGMELPHPPNYLKVHGRDTAARANGDEDCLVCHSKAACDGCHGMPMPHPEGFMSAHAAETGEYGRETCSRCHPAATCDECHTRHTHPGVAPTVLDQLRSRPVEGPQ
jgi:hypothetical protein